MKNVWLKKNLVGTSWSSKWGNYDADTSIFYAHQYSQKEEPVWANGVGKLKYRNILPGSITLHYKDEICQECGVLNYANVPVFNHFNGPGVIIRNKEGKLRAIITYKSGTVIRPEYKAGIAIPTEPIFISYEFDHHNQ